MVKGKVDILMVSETKIDDPFPMAQFSIVGFTNSFRQDRDHEGGGIIIYVRDDIPCTEINLHKTKWVLFGGYNPKKEQSLDKYIGSYDNILLLGDYNS